MAAVFWKKKKLYFLDKIGVLLSVHTTRNTTLKTGANMTSYICLFIFLNIYALKVALHWIGGLKHAVGLKYEVLPLPTPQLTLLDKNSNLHMLFYSEVNKFQ